MRERRARNLIKTGKILSKSVETWVSPYASLKGGRSKIISPIVRSKRLWAKNTGRSTLGRNWLRDSRISNFLKISNAYPNIIDAVPFQLWRVEYCELTELSMASDGKPASILHGNKMCASRREKLGSVEPAWRKADSWKIARLMTKEELVEAEIGRFLVDLS